MEASEKMPLFYELSSVHIDNNGKDILILGEGPTQGLDDTTLTTEAKYHINFTQSGKIFVLNLQYNGSISFLFVICFLLII